MTCGCCREACPQFPKDNQFVGTQVFAQALYFNEHATEHATGATEAILLREWPIE